MRKKAIGLSLLVIIIGISIYFGVMAAIPPSPSLVEQPILFNHKRHQEKDVSCYDCHQCGWNIELQESEVKDKWIDLIIQKPFAVDQVLNIIQEGMILRERFKAT